ncbi:hypothetical protein PENTCL1PPCAC_9083, partial [Pristionchus entomophagus]
PQLIASRGYPAETHHVTTEDGYILTLHRIPRGRNGSSGGRPVLLQHGLASSSFDFLSPLTNQALSYALADAGYDVWMGNNRGNIYSDKHVGYNNFDHRFWNFSWDEMGIYDYPAMIDYIVNVTGEPQLYLVGHSQVRFFSKDLSSQVKYFFALAPSLSSTHLGSALLQFGVAHPGLVEDESIIQSRLNIITAHFPAGTSNKNWLHWLQQATNGTKYFDYGVKGNLAEYGTPYPREYNFSSYRVPTSIYFSPSDKLVSSEDQNIALSRLPSSALYRVQNITGFGHFQFLWGDRAKADIYDEIIGDINAMEGN